MSRNGIVTCILAIAVHLPGNAGAQAPGERLPPIRVALVTQLPQAGARAMVVRGVGNHNQDLILVTESTTGPDLARAAQVLLRARGSRVVTTSAEVRAYIQPSSDRNAPGVAYSTSFLAELKKAPSKTVGEFGKLRTLEMDIRVKPTRTR
jgi:hypothetical protein